MGRRCGPSGIGCEEGRGGISEWVGWVLGLGALRRMGGGGWGGGDVPPDYGLDA